MRWSRRPASEPGESLEARHVFERDTLSYQILRVLRRAMEEDGVSHEELSRRMGVSSGRMLQILSGDLNLSLDTLARLSVALDRRFTFQLETPSFEDESTTLLPNP